MYSNSNTYPHAACTQGMVRLYGGATPAQGIVLMCMGNTLGPVCGNYWVTAQVKVVCGQLGYTGKYMYGGMPSDLTLI